MIEPWFVQTVMSLVAVAVGQDGRGGHLGVEGMGEGGMFCGAKK